VKRPHVVRRPQVVPLRPHVFSRPHPVVPVWFWLTLIYLLLTYRDRAGHGPGDAF